MDFCKVVKALGHINRLNTEGNRACAGRQEVGRELHRLREPEGSRARRVRHKGPGAGLAVERRRGVDPQRP
eukprot:2090580-Alexandrium_andersonii.AAC.1